MSLTFSSCKTNFFNEPELLVPLTVDEDHSLPAIEISDTKLHSEAYGNPLDPMIVAIHGGPGADYRSILNLKNLSNDGYYVIFYDQRGTGLSRRHDADFYADKTVQFFIDDLKEVINYYRKDENQKLILAGHSWGAMLATAYIDQNPHDVDAVILAEPGGFTWEVTKQYIGRSQGINILSDATNDALYKDQFLTGTDHASLDYKFLLLSTSSNTGDASPPPAWRYGAELFNFSFPFAENNPEDMDFTKNLESFNTQVLFTYSEQNHAYGKDHALLVSSAFPNVRLKEIPNCGHEIIHTSWDYLYPIITDYLNKTL